LDLAATWQKVQAFFSFFVYSGFPYESVEHARAPKSRTNAGIANFIYLFFSLLLKGAISGP
jgi:hypothetical protein